MISLIVSTMGRVAEIGELFDSLLADASAPFEVILVDQNPDARLDALVAPTAGPAWPIDPRLPFMPATSITSRY